MLPELTDIAASIWRTPVTQLSVNIHLTKFKFETQEHLQIFPWFLTPMQSILAKPGIKNSLEESFRKLLFQLDQFISEGSGWDLREILTIKVTVAKYKVLSGGCKNQKLPEMIKNKHVCINISCDDGLCFIWAILAGLYPVKSNPNRKSHYERYFSKLDISSITFPINLNDLNQFEKQNKLSLNVFGYEDKVPHPLYITENRKCNTHLDLLLYRSHFFLIKDVSRLFCTFFKIRRAKLYYCQYCLLKLRSDTELKKHLLQCVKSSSSQFINMPNQKSHMTFKNYSKQSLLNFYFVADFETLNEKLTDKQKTPKTVKDTILTPNGFSIIRGCLEQSYTSAPYIYLGPNPVKHFVNFLLSQRAHILSILALERQPIKCTLTDLKDFRSAKKCYICGAPFTKTRRRVRDHLHLGKTGVYKDSNYLGCSCDHCNLKHSALESNPMVPIILHNSMKFDNKLIIKSIYDTLKESEIRVIPKTSEHFISFSFECFQVLDSYLFLPSSLDKLVNNLLQSGSSNFKYINRFVKNKKLLPFVFRKGIMPYDYISSWNSLKETKLPPRVKFYNKLTQKHVTKADYKYAKQFWQAFNCHTIADFVKYYMALDTMLLYEVISNFRERTFALYKLDCLKYFTLSHYAFDAMLKMTGVQLELLNSLDQWEYFENNLRGGLSGPTKRYLSANNPQVPGYDPLKPCSYIFFVDCVSLYSAAMRSYLPYKGFRWLNDKELSTFDVMSIPDEGSKGYVIECNLEYPRHLHDLHCSYPLAPEKMYIRYEDLSPYTKDLAAKFNIKMCKVQKLVNNLKNKINYTVHYLTLKLYIKLGLKVTRVHRILGFYQKPWMRPFVDFNVRERAAAKTEFDRLLVKNLLNSCFGKTIQNCRTRVDYRLVNSPKTCLRLVSKPNFSRVTVFDHKLMGIQMKKTNIILNRPLFVGYSVLEISKSLMYSFYYEYIVKKFCSSSLYDVTMSYTDTDSNIIFIQNRARVFDLYDEIAPDIKKYFDTSNFDKNSKYYSNENRYLPGKFKCELGGKIIDKYVALRSKSYSILPVSGKEIKKCKGIPSNSLIFKNYVSALFDQKKISHTFQSIRSIKQTLYCVTQNRVGLSVYDDKRYYLSNVDSLPYGHYKILKRKLSDKS
jgi:hypothetical protein